MYVRQTRELSCQGALIVLQGAMTKATQIGIPQCIAVVDRAGHLLAYARMDGAKLLSQLSSTQKAVTAASSRVASGGIPAELELKLGLVTEGQLTNLKGGMPIVWAGEVIGAIGVGSGTGEQDVEVAQAGIQALMEALTEEDLEL
ncbi:MAG: heme-binding protein [Cyanobacteriota bacterium]|nr:heme-binding protein [Cyanobacteriota bacterium]